jgi:hypothetical protein
MKGDKFDPNDDQQSVADTDFVECNTYARVETKTYQMQRQQI